MQQKLCIYLLAITTTPQTLCGRTKVSHPYNICWRSWTNKAAIYWLDWLKWQRYSGLVNKYESCPLRQRCTTNIPGKDTLRRACFTPSCKLRLIPNAWWNNLTLRTQICADLWHYRGLCEALDAVHGPSHKSYTPLHSADIHNLLTHTTFILVHGSVYLYGLFSAYRAEQWHPWHSTTFAETMPWWTSNNHGYVYGDNLSSVS